MLLVRNLILNSKGGRTREGEKKGWAARSLEISREPGGTTPPPPLEETGNHPTGASVKSLFAAVLDPGVQGRRVQHITGELSCPSCQWASDPVKVREPKWPRSPSTSLPAQTCSPHWWDPEHPFEKQAPNILGHLNPASSAVQTQVR